MKGRKKEKEKIRLRMQKYRSLTSEQKEIKKKELEIKREQKKKELDRIRHRKYEKRNKDKFKEYYRQRYLNRTKEQIEYQKQRNHDYRERKAVELGFDSFAQKRRYDFYCKKIGIPQKLQNSEYLDGIKYWKENIDNGNNKENS